jgi:hypothetical protein
MANKNANGESLVLIVHEHWVKYVRPSLVYILLLSVNALLFYLAGLSAYHYNILTQWTLIAAILLLLITHHWFFMAILSQAENHIIVTSNRVIWIRHRLFFDEEMHEYAFEKMKTVEARKKNFIEYLFQYGTIEFESGAPITFVPHPNSVARAIEQAMGMT